MKWKSPNPKRMDNEEDESKQIISLIQQSSDSSIQGNKIYFYNEVNRDSILLLAKQIDELTKQMKLVQFTYNFISPPAIELHICSEGGDVFSALSVVDKIISNSVPIHTYCEGAVASAGTLISVVGHKRFISPNSFMLLHQIQSQFWGAFGQLKDEVSNVEVLMKTIKSIYLKRTKFKTKELEDLLKHDLYLPSDKCLEMGVVDVII